MFDDSNASYPDRKQLTANGFICNKLANGGIMYLGFSQLTHPTNVAHHPSGESSLHLYGVH